MINNAAFFGIIFPGLGQIIQGRINEGYAFAGSTITAFVVFLILTKEYIEHHLTNNHNPLIGLLAIVCLATSIVMYLYSLIDAAQYKSKEQLEQEELVRLQLKQFKDV